MADRSTGSTAHGESLIQSSPLENSEEGSQEQPRGTLVLLLFFLVAMVGIWLYVYFLLLDRQ
ncbi:MAG: hypothetical protein U0031_02175 [Thermomicrobiales bacterium]